MFLSTDELIEGLAHIKQSPRDYGTIEQIVCRSDIGKRKRLERGELCVNSGLVGDNWLARGCSATTDGAAHPDMQLNLMNVRAIALIAQTKERWQLAGDQFFIDLDLSPQNLPSGSRLEMGEAEIEITAEPHLGCKKFMERFGKDAAVFVNSAQGKALNLRGVNARVVKPGQVTVGAIVRKENK